MDGISTSCMKVYGVSRTNAEARSLWSKGMRGFGVRHTWLWDQLYHLMGGLEPVAETHWISGFVSVKWNNDIFQGYHVYTSYEGHTIMVP